MMDDAELVRQAREVLDGVTPGPWTVEYKSGLTRLLMNGDCQMCDEKYYPWVPENLKDWEFIAWCREGVPAMAARIDALIAERDAARDAALEEAAKVVEGYSAERVYKDEVLGEIKGRTLQDPRRIAAAIRAMKGKSHE